MQTRWSRPAGIRWSALLVLLGCDDATSLVQVPPGIEVEPENVDVGSVQLGQRSGAFSLFVRNSGGTPLVVEASLGSELDGVFGLEPRQATIAPNGVRALGITFEPVAVGRLIGTLTLRTNVPDRPTVEVPVAGTGVTTTLAVDPQRVDFRNVVVGTTESRTVTLTNTSGVDADVEYASGPNVKACAAGASEPGVFCVRARDGGLDANGRIRLPAGGVRTLDVQFAPVVAGTRSDGAFTLKACASSACEVRVTLTGAGVEAGLRCRPTSVDFGQVDPGGSATRTVTCENIANERATLLGWGLTPSSDRAFAAEATRPQVLEEGQSVTVETRFAPTALGDVQGVLRFETDNANPSLRNIDIVLRGTGGGPNIQVQPARLDFGRVSLIAPARRSLVISNVGFAPLAISEIQVDAAGTGVFTSPDAASNVLQPGESQLVTVEIAPIAEGVVESRLRILSNDGDQPSLEVPLRGEGVSLPPCQFAIVPSNLSFGVVTRTRSLRRSFEVRNLADPSEPENVCLLSAVRLLQGSDASYALPGPEVVSREIAAGSAETIEVEFLPAGAGTFTGRVELSISSPTTPFPTVDLSGVGGDGTLLVVPNEVDFGTIGVGCAARARTITLYNTGTAPIRIDAIDLAAPVQPAFTLASRPMPLPGGPLNLPSGQSARFDVGFRAARVSAYAGALEIQTTEAGTQRTYVVSLRGRGAVDAIQVEEFVQLGKPKVDILFVVDTSCSMEDEQTALGANFQAFVQFAEAQGIDYQLGATTADTDTDFGMLCSAVTGTTRSSRPSGPAQLRIVTPRTLPSPAAVFGSNASFPQVPGIPAEESGLLAGEQALSPPTIYGHNGGFVRPDAVLSMIFISDARDASPGSVDYYLNFFLSIKGFRNTNLFSASAIVAPFEGCTGPGGSGYSDPAPGRYHSVANRTGGVIQSICTSDWSRALEELSTTAFGFKSRFFLSNQPVESTLEVLVDGVALPKVASNGTVNWSYDFTGNSIVFAPYSTPEPGAQIRVTYRVECL